MKQLFYSLISLVVALFFVLLGVISIMLPWSAAIRTVLIQFILENTIAISLFGFSLIVIGLAILLSIAFQTRRKYYRLRSGSHSVRVDEPVLQAYLDSYWKTNFPKAYISNSIDLKNNIIHVTADLPYVPPLEQKALLERIRNDLKILFDTSIGYKHPFYMYASFQKEKNNDPRGN